MIGTDGGPLPFEMGLADDQGRVLGGYDAENEKVIKDIPFSDQLAFTDKALRGIINSYTREAGLRNCEREIAAIARKVARRVAEGGEGKVRVTPASLQRYIGAPKTLPEERLKKDAVGIATGLAWTATGGDVLFVEASTMKGKGGLTLTGHLGDVMKESAQAALSYARSRAPELGLGPHFYEDLDIHLHVPSGAIPKDGPSAAGHSIHIGR